MKMQGNVARAVVGVSKGRGRPRLRLAGLIALMGWLCLLANLPVYGQATPASLQAGQNGRAPLSHLYWHFLVYQNHLDKTAAAREQRGRAGSWWANHSRQGGGFRAPACAGAGVAAAGWGWVLRGIDWEVGGLMGGAGGGHSGFLSSPKDPPPVPPRLLELRDEREAT